jgi:hypothetical protein
MQPDRLARIAARYHPRPVMILHDSTSALPRKCILTRKNLRISTDNSRGADAVLISRNVAAIQRRMHGNVPAGALPGRSGGRQAASASSTACAASFFAALLQRTRTMLALV